MLILITLAIISLVVGALFLFNAKLLENFMDTLNKVVIETKALSGKQNKILGVLLVMLACILFFIAQKVKR